MSDDLEIINPPNLLKSKVKSGGPGAVDAETLDRAEAAIADMTDQYLEWVEQDLKRIEEAYAGLRDASPDNIPAELQKVFQVSHDIKGQGGSFGYDLMTSVGNYLCRLIEYADPQNPKLVDAIGVHIDTLKLVIAQRIKGDGGEAGHLMLKGLQQIFDKTANQDSVP
jgi:chemotaxis protein histidine kinase CheA